MKDKIVTIRITCMLTTLEDNLVISQGIKYRARKSFVDHGRSFYYTLIGAGDVNGVVVTSEYAMEVLPLSVETKKTERKIKIRHKERQHAK